MRIEGFSILSRIGQGSFGQIYTVRSNRDGRIYAAKIEPSNTLHRTIHFETKVMRSLQKSKYIPRYHHSGKTDQITFLIMDLLGPSFTSVLRRMQQPRLSTASGLRVAWHLLHGLEDIHRNGIIHRDVKPANILIRNNHDYPIALIDFGLARVFVDNNGQHLPPRPYPGFRGTAIYASVNAHMHLDLSRRDDLHSWFYVVTDLLTGSLPWKRLDNRADILNSKRKFDVQSVFGANLPELCEIWRHIKGLAYEQRPDYHFISRMLEGAISRLKINVNSPYDWKDTPAERHKETEGGSVDTQRASLAMSSRSDAEDKQEQRGSEGQRTHLNRTPLLEGRRNERIECCGCTVC